MSAGPNLYSVLGVPHAYEHVAASAVTGGILILGGLYVRSKLSDQNLEKEILPAPKFNLLNAMVEIVQMFRNLLRDMIGHGSETYLPIIIACFLMILVGNLSGLVPGLVSPTENINNNFAMAIFVFVAYQFFGIKEHGFHYAKQFTGGLPVPGYGAFITAFLVAVAGLVVMIELAGHIVRPFSLSLRLWGVVTGGHALVGTVSGLIPLFLPIVVMALELLVSFIQAFVFSALSTVYIKLAVSHDH